MNMPYWFSNLAYWSAQVALLGLVAGFLPHIFKIRQPRVLLIYWRALIAAALLLPFAQPWHRPESFTKINFAPAASEFTSIVIGAPAPVATHWYLPSAQIVAAIIGLILLAGIAVRFIILALGLLKLRQFRRASSPISSHVESTAVLDEMRIRVNTSGEFRISSDVESPVTFGLAAPVILLPERFPTLDAQYQSTIACHELLHVRRGDWAHHLSEEILRAALWFHPAIAWLISRIRLSREQVVDLEVINLTGARKPYLEALLEFTNSRALATAIPAPPFLVERQLAERVALMLKEVRMSRTRLIASLTAIAACLALVATLAIRTFPLKAAPKISLPPLRTYEKSTVEFVPSGIIGGVADAVTIGAQGGIVGGINQGVSGGVKGGVNGGVTNGQSSTPSDPNTRFIVGGMVTDPIPGDPDHFLVHTVSPIAIPASQPQQYENAPRNVTVIATKRVAPVYPHLLVENHLEGRINLTVTVNSEGKVSNVEFVNGAQQFAQSATDALYQWEFSPPAKAPAIISATIDFVLSPSRREGQGPSIASYKDPRAVSGLSLEVITKDPSPEPASAPTNQNDSRYIGKFQYIPPATASSGTTQNIPPFVTSPPHGVLTVGPSISQPSPVTNQGVFVNVAPSAPANSPNPNPQNISSPIFRAGKNGVTMPICEYCPKPEYTQEARDAHLQGTAYLQVTVLTTGRAGEIKLIKGFDAGLDEQAIKVVRDEWTFKPATDQNGNLVDVVVPVEISFQLYGPPQPPQTPAHSSSATLATELLTSSESIQAKIFKGPVTDNAATAPSYMGLVNTQTIYAPQPELPRLARQAHVQGSVTLNIIVNTDGKVVQVNYVSGPAMLAQSAIDTVRNWIIKGAHEGTPVSFQMSVEVSFNDK
jgi:TonB family protein